MQSSKSQWQINQVKTASIFTMVGGVVAFCVGAYYFSIGYNQLIAFLANYNITSNPGNLQSFSVGIGLSAIGLALFALGAIYFYSATKKAKLPDITTSLDTGHYQSASNFLPSQTTSNFRPNQSGSIFSPDQPTKECPICGALNGINYSFCFRCGHPL